MRLTLKRFINLLSEKHLSVNTTSLALLTSHQQPIYYMNASKITLRERTYEDTQ